MNLNREEYVAKMFELNSSVKFYKERIAKLEIRILRSQSGGGLKSLSLEKAEVHLRLLSKKLIASSKQANNDDNYELYSKLIDWKDNIDRQLAQIRRSQRAKVNIFEFSYELIAEIKERISIADMVDELNIPRKRSGSNRYVLCCPFHDEQTPSFMIYIDTDTYHCFGCQAHGDAIDFYQNILGIEFDEALIQLSNKLGITILDADKFDAAESLLKNYKERLNDVEKDIEKLKKTYGRSLTKCE